MITTSEDDKVEFHCGKCGNALHYHEFLNMPMLYVYCSECEKYTPYFHRLIDAYLYYKKEFGLNYEYIYVKESVKPVNKE